MHFSSRGDPFAFPGAQALTGEAFRAGRQGCKGCEEMNTRLKLALALVASALPVASANAWIITQTTPAPGAGQAESIVMRYDWDPGVDLFEIHKFFAVDEQPLELSFVRQPGDANTIRIVDEIILNMFTTEKRDWEDYHVELIVDQLSTKKVQFINPGGARAWQQSGGETRLGWVPTTADPNVIEWKTADPNQFVPYGDFSAAPYNQLVLEGLQIDVSELGPNNSFRLKQWPTTPEPSTMALLLTGLLGLAFAKKTRRRR